MGVFTRVYERLRRYTSVYEMYMSVYEMYMSVYEMYTRVYERFYECFTRVYESIQEFTSVFTSVFTRVYGAYLRARARCKNYQAQRQLRATDMDCVTGTMKRLCRCFCARTASTLHPESQGVQKNPSESDASCEACPGYTRYPSREVCNGDDVIAEAKILVMNPSAVYYVTKLKMSVPRIQELEAKWSAQIQFVDWTIGYRMYRCHTDASFSLLELVDFFNSTVQNSRSDCPTNVKFTLSCVGKTGK
jgi:hypothetical protein